MLKAKRGAGKKSREIWVRNWRRLANPSLQETLTELRTGLRELGLMELETTEPTYGALRNRVAAIGRDGTAMWNKSRWRSIARESRRAEKRDDSRKPLRPGAPPLKTKPAAKPMAIRTADAASGRLFRAAVERRLSAAGVTIRQQPAACEQGMLF